MPEKITNYSSAAQEIEIAIGRLDSLSTQSCVAVKFLPKLVKEHFQPSELVNIIESEPALTSKILFLISQHGVSFSDGRFSLAHALDKLSSSSVRKALLSIKVSPTFESETGDSIGSLQSGKGLLLHSVAVACCAGEIAQLSSPKMDSQLAYMAGLLHDIGKLAIAEVMPKSFAIFTKEAQSQKQSLSVIEQKHLGINHTIIGRRLAEKWHFPHLITLAIWLHHSQTVLISGEMPEARVAAIVQLADSIVRAAGIGYSGSYNNSEQINPIAKFLDIDEGKLEQIRQSLPAKIATKREVLGLTLTKIQEKYFDTAQSIMRRFSDRNIELSEDNSRLQSVSSHYDFVKEFLHCANLSIPAINIAQDFAVRWQRFYQTGKVCLYLIPPSSTHMIEAVVVEHLSRSTLTPLSPPSDISLVPKPITSKFEVLNAHEHINWLFDQIETPFDTQQTKLIPLLYGNKSIGIVAFELFYPSDKELFMESFRTSASIGGLVLGMALEHRKNQYCAEIFARLVNAPSETIPTKESEEEPEFNSIAEISLDALAEMAAGAAHELNNPLAVVSGRAQLLAEAESNQEKKQILLQIQENANEASEIIEDLMSFAEPPRPKASNTNIEQMLDEAVQLACRKTGLDKLDVQIDIDEEAGDVFVDSAQIVSAIANIISNAIESYDDEIAPIKVTVKAAESADFVQVAIVDKGCGMDKETLEKAIQPFFSAKPAGRKRGMGLAYAARLIQLNKGLLGISSELDEGTTVNIYLPSK